MVFPNNVDKQAFHQALYNGSSVYKQAIKGVLKKLTCFPRLQLWQEFTLW